MGMVVDEYFVLGMGVLSWVSGDGISKKGRGNNTPTLYIPSCNGAGRKEYLYLRRAETGGRISLYILGGTMKKNCSTCVYWQGTDQSYTEWCTKVSARVPFDYGCSQHMARPNNGTTKERDYSNSRGDTTKDLAR